MAFDTLTELGFLTVGNNFEAFQDSGGDAIVIQLTPRETFTLVFTVAADGTTDKIIIQTLRGHQINTGLTLAANSGAANLVDLNVASDAIDTDDIENATYFVMLSGDEQGELRLVTDSTNSNNRLTLDHNLSGNPSSGESYARYRLSAFEFKIDLSAAISEDNPHNRIMTADATRGEFLLVQAKRDGTTDAHQIRMSLAGDGVSIQP